MATKGKLEGLITVPTGGWTASINDGGGADVATIAAGTYYMSSPGSGANDFLAEVAAKFGAASGRTWTCTGSHGEGGTGIVTLTVNVSSSITWTSTDLRDVLGFTGNLTTATSHVATQSARSIWLPSCEYNARVGGLFRGVDETDLRTTESAAGHTFAFSSQRKVVNALRWDAITLAKSWIIGESTVNQSFQKFFRDVIFGEASWTARPAGPIRWYPDAATDANYITYYALGMTGCALEQFVEDYGGLYKVMLPRLVEVPS